MIVVIADCILVAHEMLTDVCVLAVELLSPVLVYTIIDVCHHIVLAIHFLLYAAFLLLALLACYVGKFFYGYFGQLVVVVFTRIEVLLDDACGTFTPWISPADILHALTSFMQRIIACHAIHRSVYHSPSQTHIIGGLVDALLFYRSDIDSITNISAFRLAQVAYRVVHI